MKKLTKKQLNEQVLVTCYGKTKPYKREQAIDFFYEGANSCDGCEAERYWKIYSMLTNGEMHAYDEAPPMYEHCPNCDKDVKISAEFIVQICPECGKPILPCALCKPNKPNCQHCPLEAEKNYMQSLFDKWNHTS